MPRLWLDKACNYTALHAKTLAQGMPRHRLDIGSTRHVLPSPVPSTRHEKCQGMNEHKMQRPRQMLLERCIEENGRGWGGHALPRHGLDMPRQGLDKAPHDMGLTRHAKIWLDMPQYGQKACHNKGLTCLDTDSTWA
jgi:hypothetical protein